MLLALKRRLHRHLLRDPLYAFLFEPPPPGEAVSVDCETTGLSTRKDDIVAVAAIRIRGNRILTSERFEATVKPRAKLNAEAIKVHRLREQDVASGRSIDEVLLELLRFIGSRPLVGFYLEFDVAMLNKHMRRLLGIELPNQQIEVSGIYYRRKYGDAPPGTQVDLRFISIMTDLGLPLLDQHDAYSDALMTAMMYLKLRDLEARDIRIARQRAKPVS
ncbi:MAG: 3'-5' exonuclease [Hyphomicrobiales bacterium]|nr:3'-5' exonuclease [Hyphomicrobiales bacterium]MBV8443733.1 3'-5' exonuclease [Hyphomicrobiales bacterium]